MGNPIVKLDGRYVVWSTISDSPVTFGMTRDELEAWIGEESGREGLRDLPARIARLDAKGTSSLDAESADDTVWLNRAGPGEKPLHRAEIVEFFVRRRVEPTPAALAEFRAGLAHCGPTCPSIPVDGCASFCEWCWGTGFVRRPEIP